MTKKIDSMTPEQEALMPVYLEKYLREGRRTISQAPINRELATELIERLYVEILGLKKPRVIFTQSPAETAITSNRFKKSKDFKKEPDPVFGENVIMDFQKDALMARFKKNPELADDLQNLYYCSWWWNYKIVYDFAINVLGMEVPEDLLKKFNFTLDLLRETHIISPFSENCFVSEFPTILKVDERGRLHCEDGPALAYRDGCALFSVHGVRIPWTKSHIITDIPSMTVEEIDNEENQEIKRIMIQQYGLARFIKDSNAEVLDRDVDQYGRERVLYKKEIKGEPNEPLVMVHVKNSTAEPDGTFKDYFLRIDPRCRPFMRGRPSGEPQELTCQNAVASTWGLRGEEYLPSIET